MVYIIYKYNNPVLEVVFVLFLGKGLRCVVNYLFLLFRHDF